MSLFRSFSDNSEAQHFIYFHFQFPSAGRSFMLEFRYWSSKYILFGAFQIASVLLVICCSDFVFQERSSFLLIWGRIRWFSMIMDHDSDLLDAVGITMDFFKQPQASVQIEATWLPFETVAFGSPPEDLLFRYLLFVPIEYHGNPNFSRWNVSQIQTSVFVQATDFEASRPFRRWLADGGVIW